MISTMTKILLEDIALLEYLVQELAKIHKSDKALLNISKKIVTNHYNGVQFKDDKLWNAGDPIPPHEIDKVIDIDEITPEIRLCIHEKRTYYVSQQADVYNLFSYIYRYITNEHLPIQMIYSRSKRAEYLIKKRYAGSSDIYINQLLDLIYSCLQINIQKRPKIAMEILEMEEFISLTSAGINNQT